MSELHIHRTHPLGLDQARQLAARWADQARDAFAMECTLVEGEHCDTMTLRRSGVEGRLLVAGDHFDLRLQLGFLFSAFSERIREQIEKNLDGLLAGHGDGQNPGQGHDRGQAP